MEASSDESKQALLGAVSRALESYEQGKVNPQHFSALLENLQVVLQAVADGAEGDSDGGPCEHEGASDVANGVAADQYDDASSAQTDVSASPGAAACQPWLHGCVHNRQLRHQQQRHSAGSQQQLTARWRCKQHLNQQQQQQLRDRDQEEDGEGVDGG
ncbi:hypothetical protein Agub_g15697, partial [Astrephomene gubernaculifera]